MGRNQLEIRSVIRSTQYILLCLIICLFICSCERPFIEPSAPTVKILSPDADVVNTTGTATIRLEAASFRRVDRVTLNGNLMSYITIDGRWESTVKLNSGLNTYIIAAFDEDNVAHYDTLRTLYHTPSITTTNVPILPQARGGHTATLLSNGDIVVIGGATSERAAATSDVWTLGANSNTFTNLETGLTTARTGHTATLLNDGRILILGGSKVEDPTSISDLVETVEIYNPVSRTFKNVPVIAKDPIRRTHHTTFLYPDVQNPQNSVYVYLFGGRGDIRYGDTPTIGTRQDMRIFQLKNDTLRTASPTFGTIFTPLQGHSLTSIFQGSNQTEARYVIAGNHFESNASNSANNADGTPSSFMLDLKPKSLREFVMRAFFSPRTRHSAAFFGGNEILFAGGKEDLAASAKEDFEIYVVSAKKMFKFPTSVRMNQKRFGHTATFWRGNRILFIGGFNQNGNALSSTESVLF